MWVYEEVVNGERLTDIINTRKENVKYLPNIILPDNIVAVPNLLDACKDATVLVFVVPHQVRVMHLSPLTTNQHPLTIFLPPTKPVRPWHL